MLNVFLAETEGEKKGPMSILAFSYPTKCFNAVVSLFKGFPITPCSIQCISAVLTS